MKYKTAETQPKKTFKQAPPLRLLGFDKVNRTKQLCHHLDFITTHSANENIVNIYDLFRLKNIHNTKLPFNNLDHI